MNWFSSPTATRVSIDRQTFIGEQASNGHFYFELPSNIGSEQAASVGLALSGPPPPPALPFDSVLAESYREQLVSEIMSKVEERFARLVQSPL